MKQSFRMLSVLGASLLTSMAALAGDWTYPTPKGQPWAIGDTVYIYNVGQSAFLTTGEAYGTQSVVDSLGGEIYSFQAKTAGNGTTGASVGDYPVIKNITRSGCWIFRVQSDGTVGTNTYATFGDNNANIKNQWVVTDLGNNIYSLQMPQASAYTVTQNADGTNDTTIVEHTEWASNWYYGIQLDHASDYKTNNALSQTLGAYYNVEGDPTTNTRLQWMSVSAANHDRFSAQVNLYNALNEAEAGGIATADAEAVYNNADATTEELTKAASALRQALADRVNPQNPEDVTATYVKNSTFDSGVTGWSYSTGAQNHGTATNISNDAVRNSEGAFSGNFYENWNPNVFTGRMYTKITSIPNGVYKVGIAAAVNGYDNDNATNMSQYVYANDTKQALQNDDKAHAYTMIVSVDADTLEIGLAQDSAICNWIGVDNVTLTYYGSGLASYQYLSTDLKENNPTPLVGYEYNSDYYDPIIEAAIEAGETATDKDAALKSYHDAVAAIDAAKLNASLYTQLQNLCNTIEQEDGDGLYGNSSDAVMDKEAEALDIVTNLASTNEEITAAISELETLRAEAKKSGYEPGQEADILTNPNFYDDATQTRTMKGWTIEGSTPGGGGNADNRLCEVYEGESNVYQTVSGIQKGAYRVEMQAFMRMGSAANAATLWQQGDTTTKAWIYANGNETNVKSIISAAQDEAGTTASDWVTVTLGDETKYVPNMMTSSYELMDANPNNYLNVVNTIVDDTTLTVGLRVNDPAKTGARWFIFRDFKITYLGNDAEAIGEVLNPTIAEANELLQQGMSAATKQTLSDAVQTAQTALEEETGMLQSYRPLVNAINAASTSVTSYSSLKTAIDNLTQALSDYAETARETSISDANTVLATETAAYNNGTLADSAVAAEVTKINGAINALKVPKGTATDDNPQDMSSLIVNNNFIDGQTGWTFRKISGDGSPSTQSNCGEGWNCNFDIHQDITGLPQGTYKVVCHGYFRPVSAEWAWNAYLGDSIGNSVRGKIYANYGDSVAPKYWVFNYDPEELSATGDGWSTLTKDSVSYYYPNMRNAARVRFDQFPYNNDGTAAQGDPYYNELYTYVNESGTLRIGFCNTQYAAQDWFVTSDWGLYYYGDESKHATGIKDVNADVAGEAVSTQIYTVDGAQVNKLQKGVNIVKTTDVNGKVTTKKVIVK